MPSLLNIKVTEAVNSLKGNRNAFSRMTELCLVKGADALLNRSHGGQNVCLDCLGTSWGKNRIAALGLVTGCLVVSTSPKTCKAPQDIISESG